MFVQFKKKIVNTRLLSHAPNLMPSIKPKLGQDNIMMASQCYPFLCFIMQWSKQHSTHSFTGICQPWMVGDKQGRESGKSNLYIILAPDNGHGRITNESLAFQEL